MARGRTACRTDSNHSAVVEALRNAAIEVQSLAQVGEGCPDLLCGFRGINVVLEVKDGGKFPSQQALTAAEREWHARWAGQVNTVNSPEHAVETVLAIAKIRGVI